LVQLEEQRTGTCDYPRHMQDATAGADSRQDPNGTYNIA